MDLLKCSNVHVSHNGSFRENSNDWSLQASKKIFSAWSTRIAIFVKHFSCTDKTGC